MPNLTELVGHVDTGQGVPRVRSEVVAPVS